MEIWANCRATLQSAGISVFTCRASVNIHLAATGYNCQPILRLSGLQGSTLRFSFHAPEGPIRETGPPSTDPCDTSCPNSIPRL